MITLILRSLIIYLIVLFAVRIMGKRQIGDMQPFELVVTLIIADLACIPMSDVSIPLVFGIVPLLTLVVLHHGFTLLNRKSIFFRKLLNGKPIIVIDGDGINYPALKQLNMTLNDLTEGLRGCECFDLADVAFAIVETNGNISVLLKSTASPATSEQLKLTTEQSALNYVLVNDGKVMEENLNELELSQNFLQKLMKSQKTKSVSDILVLTINSNGNVYYQEKNKPCKTFMCEVKE